MPLRERLEALSSERIPATRVDPDRPEIDPGLLFPQHAEINPKLG